MFHIEVMEEPPVQDLRRRYTQGQLDEHTMHADPMEQFAAWFKEACQASLDEPNAMSLATVSEEGQPSLRTVLLKGYGPQGFDFYTNLESQKGQQIHSHPQVSLLFPWIALERQVIVYGKASLLPRAEVEAYFATRPRESQLGAWASRQSQPVASREALEASFEEVRLRFENQPIPAPGFWGGYRVLPAKMEFWQGRAGRLHDRVSYQMSSEGPWQLQRLSP